MDKKSYRAKKADTNWDVASQEEEAAGIRARQMREIREKGEMEGNSRLLPPMPPPSLPNRPSAKETAEFKSQCRIAYTALKYMVGHIDKYPHWFSDPITEELKSALHSCEYALGR